MRLRSRVPALLAGGTLGGALALVLALGGAGAAVAATPSPSPSAAVVSPGPYPPVARCGGPHGIGQVSASLLFVEQQVIFSGCGFVPGSTVAIAANGVSEGTTVAHDDTTFAVPLRFPTVGVKNLTATGPDAAAGSGASGTSADGAGTVVPAADVVATRVVTQQVTVIAGAAPGAAGASAGSGGLPFTGAQTSALVAGAVVLIGGGIALRTMTRRRRPT